MKMVTCWMLLLSVVALAGCEQERFDGHKVLKILPKTASDVHEITKMEDKYQLDFWHFPKYVNDSFHVRVSPEGMDPFLSKLRELEAEVSVWVDDVQRLVDYETKQRRVKRATTVWAPLFEYHTFEEIENKINEWHNSGVYPNMAVSLLNNLTYEKRSIPVVKITHRNGEADRSIFMDCGIHAREWISPAFCLYVIEKLLSGEEDNDLLMKYNWHIVPVLNPDGYAYSHNNNRFWRKNRRPNGNGNACPGVDLNRNFGFMYDAGIGGSENFCSDIYTGTGGFSEPESDGLQRYIHANEDQNFVSYLTIHSYGQMWLHPWGYTSDLPDDVEDLLAAGNVGAEALGSVHGTSYRVGSSTAVLYSAAGGSDDWAKGNAGIKYAYTLELRDHGYFGFVLPWEEIEPTVVETWEGVKAMAMFI